MTELQKYIDHAFSVLSCVSVKGDDVERITEVKAALRKAYQMAKPQAEPKEVPDG